MALFKKIAIDVTSGDTTEPCNACDADGKITAPKLESAPAKKTDCPWCHGTKRKRKK